MTLHLLTAYNRGHASGCLEGYAKALEDVKAYANERYGFNDGSDIKVVSLSMLNAEIERLSTDERSTKEGKPK